MIHFIVKFCGCIILFIRISPSISLFVLLDIVQEAVQFFVQSLLPRVHHAFITHTSPSVVPNLQDTLRGVFFVLWVKALSIQMCLLLSLSFFHHVVHFQCFHKYVIHVLDSIQADNHYCLMGFNPVKSSASSLSLMAWVQNFVDVLLIMQFILPFMKWIIISWASSTKDWKHLHILRHRVYLLLQDVLS